MHTHTHKMVTLVKGNPKAPFSIAIITCYRGGHYSIPWIAPFYLQVPFFESLV